MTTYIDDQDLDKVNYHGAWIQYGTVVQSRTTLVGSTHVGDHFIVTFKGTKIAVFGAYGGSSKGVVTTYSVDNEAPVRVISHGEEENMYEQQFWTSDTFSMGSHQLLVNMSKINLDTIDHDDPGKGVVWFDYFLVDDPTVIFSGSDPFTSAPQSQAASHKSIPLGAIIGGVMGGLILFSSLVILLFLCRRRTLSTAEDGDSTAGCFRDRTVNPFVLTSATTSYGSLKSKSAGEFDPDLLVSRPPHIYLPQQAVSRQMGVNYSIQASVGVSAEGVTSTVPICDQSESSATRDVEGVSQSDAHLRVSRYLEARPEGANAERMSINQYLGHLLSQHLDSDVSAAHLAAKIHPPPVYSSI